MKAPIILLLMLAIVLIGCSATIQSSDRTFDITLATILGLGDQGYAGGLAESDVALAQRLAKASGFPTSTPCTVPNPFQGVLVGNVAAQVGSQAAMPRTLRKILEGIDGDSSRHAKDVLAYAMGELGTSLKADVKVVTNRWSRSPWLRDASARILCERVAAASADEVLPATGSKRQRCAAVRELVARMADSTLQWPFGVLAKSTEEGCGYSRDIAADLVKIIGNPHQTDETRSDALSLVSAWASATHADRVGLRETFEAVALALSRASASELQRTAEQSLIEMRSPAAAQTLAQRLYAGELSWFDEAVCDFPAQADILVPALIHALSDPVWYTRVEAAQALKCFADARTVPALVAALDTPDYELHEAALVTLSHIRPWNAEVLRAVKKLAATHWSARIRRLAQIAASGKAIDDESKSKENRTTLDSNGKLETICFGLCTRDQEQSRCASGNFEDGKYRVDGEGVISVEWRRLSKQPFDASKLGDLAGRTKQCSTTISSLSADATLVGLSCSEWTGGAYVVESGKPTRQIYNQGIEGIFRVGNRTFLAAAAFLFTGESGVIGELVTDSSNGWRFAPVVTWPGIPTHFAFSPAGRVLLSDGASALSLDANGRLASMTCLK